MDFADEYGLPMTFAMTPAALKIGETDLSDHEVGVHLHPQDNTLQEVLRGTITISSDCLASFPAKDQKVLIEASKEIFENAVGRPPRTFVAGRWSENDTTLELLIEAGFRFDGSPLPGHLSPCADWTRIPRLAQPYAPSLEDYQTRGSANFLYIPVYRGLWNRYLTPENIHLLGASYFKAALKEASVGGAYVVHIFFHSPMAMDPGHLSEFATVVEYAQDDIGAQFVLPSSLEPSDKISSKSFPPAYITRLNLRLIKSFAGRGELGRRLLGSRALNDEPLATHSDAAQEENAD